MYSTYQRNYSSYVECESNPSNRNKIIILGGGPNRIGQGIEFDYCCCQASFALKDAKYETIMSTVTQKPFLQITIRVIDCILNL